MQRFALFVASIALCIFAISGFPQSSSVHLCVAGMQVNGGGADPVGRELLVKFLTKEKPNKAISIESVPIPPSAPEEALAFAKQKGCDYVVTTNQTESHSVASYNTGRLNPVNAPTFYVTTAYQLTKVSDGSDVTSGSFKASDSSSEQNAIGFSMKKIADKVTETIRKAGPIAK
jgi:hypothetical protein